MDPLAMPSAPLAEPMKHAQRRAFFYGWYIVGLGFLSHVAFAFSLASTLSVFLRPITEDFGISRGLFSLLRTGESLISAVMAPVVGPLVDRYGGRWLMVFGALVAAAGFFLLSQAQDFWQFVVVRWSLVTIGVAFMGYMVVNVAISNWFVRKRGRAIAIASLGTGVAKVSVPLLATFLFMLLGWRNTWSVFGVVMLVLIVVPALVFMRRRPEDMGLFPDGAAGTSSEAAAAEEKLSAAQRQALAAADVVWTRREVLRTSAFWLIIVTFGIAHVGIGGLNLHIFAAVTDIGYPAIVAATVMSVIATTQMGSTLLWGFLAERIDMRKAVMVKFLIQAVGLGLVIGTRRLEFVYIGFFLYGIGLGGSFVLQEIIWANYFGRLSLGTVRGVGLPITLVFGAAGPPFFGVLFDLTQSYLSSFISFIIALVVSAFLVLFLRPPRKEGSSG